MIYENILKQSRYFPKCDNCLQNFEGLMFRELPKKNRPGEIRQAC